MCLCRISISLLADFPLKKIWGLFTDAISFFFDEFGERNQKKRDKF